MLVRWRVSPIYRGFWSTVTTVQRIADRALQLHGGYGYTVDFPVERHFRDAATLRVLADGADVQRVVVAKGLAAG